MPSPQETSQKSHLTILPDGSQIDSATGTPILIVKTSEPQSEPIPSTPKPATSS